MNVDQITPAIDMAVIQEKANEYAMKGALKALEDHYSGYNSPFVKAVEQHLKDAPLSIHFELPDVIAHINKTITSEVDRIVNSAIAQTFLPKIQNFLTRVPKEMKMSDILKHIIEEENLSIDDDCHMEVSKNSQYGWLNVEMKIKDGNYSMTFHEEYNSKKTTKIRYQLLSLPYGYDKKRDIMKMQLEDGTKVEMPFVPEVLQNPILSLFARLVVCETNIEMDIDFFSEDLFPERCRC